MRRKPFCIFRADGKRSALSRLSALVAAVLLLGLGIRLFGLSQDAQQTMGGQGTEHTPQGLYALLQQQVNEGTSE